jgi:hypothetical protein
MTQPLTYNPAKSKRISGNYAHACTRDAIPFKNSNGQLYGHWTSPHLYVVFSYGEHWPLFIYSPETNCWYGNEDKTSRTTTRHYSSAFPYSGHPVMARSCTWMKRAVQGGLGFILLSHCEEEQAVGVPPTQEGAKEEHTDG